MFPQVGVSETLIRAWHMSDDECEHWMVYIINATLNDPLNQYSATTNQNVEKVISYKFCRVAFYTPDVNKRIRERNKTV